MVRGGKKKEIDTNQYLLCIKHFHITLCVFTSPSKCPSMFYSNLHIGKT